MSRLRFDEDRVLVSGMFVSSSRGRVSSGSTTDNPVVAKVNVNNRGLSTVYFYGDNETVTGVVSDQYGNVRIGMVYELDGGVFHGVTAS